MPRRLQHDRILTNTVIGLTFFGLIMVFSVTAADGNASPAQIIKQSVAVCIGLAAMRYLMVQDYREWRNHRAVFAAVGGAIVLLLAAMLIGTGANTNRFIRFGPLSLQPSEFAKLALILFLAYYLESRRDWKDWRSLGGGVLVLAALCALVLAGRDLGTVVLLALIAAVIYWAAGLPMRFFGAGLGVGLVGFALACLIDPYRVKRLVVFLDPEADPQGAGFQVMQSMIAVGSGGWFGQGLMLGRQKMRFLPEAHTDFIFAVIGEELGLIGCALVVLAFGVILWRGTRAAVKAPDAFGCYLAAGLTAMIVCQAMINVGVVLAMLPTKGMTLPFVSYGGTSMMISLAAAGLLINVSQHAE